MKRILFFLPILLLWTPIDAGYAQKQVTTVDSLVIELWPDYDRPSVLALLTCTLPADTEFPAAVTLPLPETAQLNAVARIDSSDGVMKDDIISTPGSGVIEFITPDPLFRVEYYFPYRVNNNQKSFDFTWLADLSVNKIELRVQQPTSANSFSSEPATGNVVKRENGFDYHILPVRVVPAGQPFSVRVNYKMVTAQLSVEQLPSRGADLQAPELPSESSAGSGSNWPIVTIVAGGLIIVFFFVWQIASRRSLSNTRKLRPTEAEEQSRANLCKNCDRPVDEEDKFCGTCGTEL